MTPPTPDATTPTLLLLRCHGTDAQAVRDAALRWAHDAGRTLQRAAWSHQHQLAYVYARPSPKTAPHDARWPQTEAQAFALQCPVASQVEVSRLWSVFAATGHSADHPPAFHYVVETDPEPGWNDELHRWYNTEHMPGLAAVPGCIQARRLHNRDHGPLSLACYDLTHARVLESAEWLAVRGTEWSSRVRPHFTNTRRTMMEVWA